VAWRAGPLPENTWGTGGVFLAGDVPPVFHAAYFRGDHAFLLPGNRTVRGAEVAWYDNAVTEAPAELVAFVEREEEKWTPGRKWI
jgi:hypothetical protein